jgi:hypothetical protein
MRENEPDDLITIKEARTLIGISNTKMAQLIRDGVIQHWVKPLDARVKLVSRAAVLNLNTPRRAEAA